MKKHFPHSEVDANKGTLSKSKSYVPDKSRPCDKRVVVAMSGGVDSSVAAHLVTQEGWEAIGVSMQVWDYRNHGGSCSRATCCAPDDFTDARKVAAKANIPYYVFDFEASFRKKVIDKFISSYKKGITPNPCIDCNAKVKFRELRERAASLNIPYIATGHYAQIIQDEITGDYKVIRSKERSFLLRN